MQKRLLLDGCSFTYGIGLNHNQTLEQRFIDSGYDVINISRPGKSNHAMALDIYKNIDLVDIVVAGWTFSSRWHLKYHDHDIDLLASRQQIELHPGLDNGDIEESYQDLHRSLYSLFDSAHWNQYSDMLIDTTFALAAQKNKQSVFFSWETRNTKNKLYYPHICGSHRFPDGHLNANGTIYLFDKLTAIIEQ